MKNTSIQPFTDTVLDGLFSNIFDDYRRSKPSVYSNGVTQKVTDKDLKMSFEIPGVDKENIKIEIEQNKYLVIEASSSLNDDFNKSDRKFKWVYTLPSIYDTESIEAETKNGVLYLTVKKKEESTIKRLIEIK